MSKFPRMYAESTLTRMHKKLDLPEETVKLLYDYFDAFSNFYLRLPLYDAYEIFKSQNSDLATEEQFVAFSEIARHEKHYYFILGDEELFIDGKKSEPIEREIVHQSLVDIDFDIYYNMYEAQQKKPLYVPEKSQLLKYADDFYYEETAYTRKLRAFFMNCLKFDAEKAENMVSSCVFIILTGPHFMGMLTKELERMKIEMTQPQLDEFYGIISELNNNTRIPENRGYTPSELSKMIRGAVKPKIVLGENMRNNLASGNLSKEEFIQGLMNSDLPDDMKMQMLGELSKVKTNPEKSKKIGRNEPCPCGSGKKYKKCCGR